MKTYKKLALVVACFAISETIPAEKPAPDPSTLESASDQCLAALELASMLPQVSLLQEKIIKELQTLLKINDDNNVTIPKDLFNRQKVLNLLNSLILPATLELRYKDSGEVNNVKIDQKWINTITTELKERIAKKEQTQNKINDAIAFISNNITLTDQNKFIFSNISEIKEKLNLLDKTILINIPYQKNSSESARYAVNEILKNLQQQTQKKQD